jgi:hypothetical protein
MRKLDLQPPFRSCRPFAENLEDQTGAVDHLGPELVFQILLLDGGERRVNDHQAGFILARKLRQLLRLPLADQGRGADCPQPEGAPADNDDADRFGQTCGLVQARVGGAARALARSLGDEDNRPFPARDFDRAIAVKRVQASLSASFSALSCSSLSGCAGCNVEIACL